jgi:DNA polymerase-3 subunit delta
VAPSLYGRLTLITGPESFLVERAMARLIAQAQAEVPDTGVTTQAAAELSGGLLDQMTGTDLFSSATVACLTGAEKLPKSLEAALAQALAAIGDNTAWIVCHAGGNQSKALLAALTNRAAQVIDCQPIKGKELGRFVAQEARLGGKTLTTDAAQRLVDAVGTDARSLAAAVSQLLADTDADTISAAVVNRYFAGRATTTAFAVSDDAMAGRVGEAIVKLRWALSTGVPHILITGALANSLRQVGGYVAAARRHEPTAAEIGVPAWKLRDVAATARAWSEPALAGAIRAVAQADAQIKGAAQDPDFALERLIIKLAGLRRAAQAERLT